jgi:hypothetical protein
MAATSDFVLRTAQVYNSSNASPYSSSPHTPRTTKPTIVQIITVRVYGFALRLKAKCPRGSRRYVHALKAADFSELERRRFQQVML